jgi:hypothetical protein
MISSITVSSAVLERHFVDCRIFYWYAEGHYAEGRYAEGRYAEGH